MLKEFFYTTKQYLLNSLQKESVVSNSSIHVFIRKCMLFLVGFHYLVVSSKCGRGTLLILHICSKVQHGILSDMLSGF